MSGFWIIYLVSIVLWSLLFAYGAYKDYKNNELNWRKQYCDFSEYEKKAFIKMLVVLVCPVITSFFLLWLLSYLVREIFRKD